GSVRRRSVESQGWATRYWMRFFAALRMTAKNEATPKAAPRSRDSAKTVSRLLHLPRQILANLPQPFFLLHIMKLADPLGLVEPQPVRQPVHFRARREPNHRLRPLLSRTPFHPRRERVQQRSIYRPRTHCVRRHWSSFQP